MIRAVPSLSPPNPRCLDVVRVGTYLETLRPFGLQVISSEKFFYVSVQRSCIVYNPNMGSVYAVAG